MKSGLHFLLVALLLLGCSTGQAAAPLALHDMQGSPRDLSDFTRQDQWTVVMFWASDCSVCNEEAKQYVDYSKRIANSNIQILGVSMDGLANQAAAQDFIQRNQINFDNLLVDGQLGADFYTEQTGQSWIGTPTFMIYAPKGELKAAQIGAVPPSTIDQFIKSQSIE